MHDMSIVTVTTLEAFNPLQIGTAAFLVLVQVLYPEHQVSASSCLTWTSDEPLVTHLHPWARTVRD
jgi:hypothetical protein